MEVDFRDNLLEWNRTINKRSMPWKGEKDPYKIWLSEIILQQTRVEQGLSYYNNFITNYPTVHDLANAPEEEVFKLWEGLGYYSRCKNLIASAKYISKDLAGKFPSEYDEIIKLKGVGPYTTAAIASFAFNLPFAVVDGNVQRVISRYFGINTPVDTTEGKKLYQHLAQALLDPHKPAEYNQAIMDFGAVVCKPQNPVCGDCPQKNDCQANTLGFVSSLPVKEKKLVKKHRWFYYFMINTPDAVYIRKRTEKDIWQNLHEFPMHEAQDPEPFPHKNFLRSLLGVQPYSVVSQSRVYVQQLTHQTIHGQFIQVSIPKTVSVPETFTPIAKKDLARYAFPRMLNTFLEEEFV